MSLPEPAARNQGWPSMHWFRNLVADILFFILFLAAVAIGVLLVLPDSPLKITCWKAEHITEQVAVNAGCLVTVRGL